MDERISIKQFSKFDENQHNLLSVGGVLSLKPYVLEMEMKIYDSIHCGNVS